MSNSIEATVGAALAMQDWAMMQEKDNALLRKVLDSQADIIAALVNSAASEPQLATFGSVGTRLHVTA